MIRHRLTSFSYDVGIAGEDDLDAPDLSAPPIPLLSCRDGMTAHTRVVQLRRRNDQPLATGSFQTLQ